jgi:fructose-1-phosphate kinase PfkB-like protein
MAHDFEAIRELTSAAFNDEELATFCSDHFRAVHENFAAGQTRTQRVLLLIGFAHRNAQLETLLDEIAEANPHQFGLFAIGSTTRGATPEQFAALLAELRAALAQTKLDTDERQAAEDDLAAIDSQTARPEPKLSVIEAKLSSIKALIEGTAGAGMAAPGLA